MLLLKDALKLTTDYAFILEIEYICSDTVSELMTKEQSEEYGHLPVVEIKTELDDYGNELCFHVISIPDDEDIEEVYNDYMNHVI